MAPQRCQWQDGAQAPFCTLVRGLGAEAQAPFCTLVRGLGAELRERGGGGGVGGGGAWCRTWWWWRTRTLLKIVHAREEVDQRRAGGEDAARPSRCRELLAALRLLYRTFNFVFGRLLTALSISFLRFHFCLGSRRVFEKRPTVFFQLSSLKLMILIFLCA